MTTDAIEAGARADLLPCPFCGGEAELERGNDHHGEWFNLGCSRHWGNVDPDSACVAGRMWYTEPPDKEQKAIASWNARAAIASGALVTASQLAAERERCVGVVDGYAPATTDMLSSKIAEICDDIAAAIRALEPSPASGEYVVVPREPPPDLSVATIERLWNPFQTCSTSDNRPVELKFSGSDIRRGYFSSLKRRWVDADGTPFPEGLYPTHWRPLLEPPAMLNAATKDGSGTP